MKRTPTGDEINHRKDMWQTIAWQMNTCRVTPGELARQTPYSQDLIERGVGGEPVPITSAFLRNCVRAFGLVSGRTEYNADPVENLPAGELESILKPPPEMPPRQGNFWE